MATVAEVVNSALSFILVQASEAAIEPSEAKAAVTRLNRMMASWEGGGIVLGFTPVENLGEEVTVPEYALDAIEQNLAVMIGPQFGGVVSSLLMQNARQAKSDMMQTAIEIADTSFPCTLPLGSGNTGSGFNRSPQFYPCITEDDDA